MNKARSPEFDKRDLLFAHACEKCARAGHCAFKTSPEGPEEVCWQLIEGGTYNCESCVRYMLGGGCHFKCVFFREIRQEEAPVRNVLSVHSPTFQEERLRGYSHFRNFHCSAAASLDQNDPWN